MQNDKTYSDIINALVRTRTEANLLLAEVETLERALYKIGEGDFDSTLKAAVRAKTAYALSQAIGQGDGVTLLKSLKEKINALVYLGLTIAFEPNLEIISRLHNWAKQNLGEGVALDLKIDKSILGGAIIEYKGKIGTFSLVNQVDKYFA